MLKMAEGGGSIDERKYMYCSACAVKLHKDSKYCWNCQSCQTLYRPTGVNINDQVPFANEHPGTSSFSSSSSFGRPQKLMSFEQFHKRKTSFAAAAGKKKKVEENVMINIGLKQWSQVKLKTVYGKRLPLTVHKKATYANILEKAKEKFKAFDRNFDYEGDYVLLYDDGQSAQFMPGGCKEFFDMEEYKKALGKDYKRITLYLCPLQDHMANEGIPLEEFDVPKLQDDLELFHGSDLIKSIDVEAAPVIEVASVEDPVESHSKGTFNSLDDVIGSLKSKVIADQHFYLVVRRGAPLARILKLWQHQATKTPMLHTLRVKYVGEDGIDQGAIAEEFMTDTIKMIAKEMFPGGSPINSSFHVQNGNFRTCGEIIAVALAQGGPSPSFLDENAFKCMFDTIDVAKVNELSLTRKEKETLGLVRNGIKGCEDLILENDYTGPMNEKNIDDIISSLKVSFVSKRILYMKEFGKGLDTYNLMDIILECPTLMQSIFVTNNEGKPDANYLYSCMVPQYSVEGSSKCKKEEAIMDMLQDVLLQFEDKKVQSLDTAVAFKNFDDTSEDHDEFTTAEISIPGLMKWLTGQEHKPLGRDEEIVIQVMFDHDCMQRNPKHSLCFPTVGACGRELTIPVAHVANDSKFCEIITTAYCKGNAFGRH